MTVSRKKNQPPLALDMSFSDAMDRFLQTDPTELGEAMTRALVDRMKNTEKRIREAREEIERGARSGKKPFRL